MTFLLTACGGGEGSHDQASGGVQPPEVTTPPDGGTPAPAPEPQRILVPAYFYPDKVKIADWQALTESAASAPRVEITAILNPNNGVFSQQDANIARVATDFVNAGGKMVGYVNSRYGRRATTEVLANVQAYLQHYGEHIVHGVFIDEMANDDKRLAYYQDLYRRIKSLHPQLLVIGNPGSTPTSGYAQAADVLTTFEGKGFGEKGYDSYDPGQHAGGWLARWPASAQAALVHNVSSCASMQAMVKRSASRSSLSGWIYVTDLEYEPSSGVGNPWATLPSYWPALVDTVRSLGNGLPLPGCR
ncbi:spherulation-specific family 4 protein [Comamonas composti]|uniref:spherulation-specific family 4 protein n=1 Tax=Comamonas composti TaxID=408558 RepID=UPI001B7FCA9E|nr:spherulation-specific family 4 protein [Comamonas composti]